MKKIILSLLLVITIVSLANAQTYYMWRKRSHATDCTVLTDGRTSDLCYEQDSNNLYVCNATDGLCDTPSEWKQVSSSSSSTKYVYLSEDGTAKGNNTVSNITLNFTEGFDISFTNNTATISGEDASTSNKGLAQFNSEQFSTSSGVISILADGIDDTMLDFGTGTNQINTDDIPQGSTNTYNPFGTYIDITEINTTGTPSSSTFLRGDGTWSAPEGTGDITRIGSTTSGDALVDGINTILTFEGASNDEYETVLSVIEPTQDNTINIPNESGTLLTNSSTLLGDVTGALSATVVGNDSHNHTSTTLPTNTTFLGALINLTNEIEGVLPYANGGTGISSWTNGQIPIGSTGVGLVAASLTEGEGIDVTGAAGSITLSGEDASTSNKGISQYSSSDFVVSSGNVSLASTVARTNQANTFTGNQTISGSVSVVSGLTVGGSLMANGGLQSSGDTRFGAVSIVGNLTVTNGTVSATGGNSTNWNTAYSHTSNTSNPHAVTKAQVNLSNVDDTSDLAKPISNLTQTALDGKQATLTNTSDVTVRNLTATSVSISGSGVSVQRIWNALHTFWADLTSGNQTSNITITYPIRTCTLAGDDQAIDTFGAPTDVTTNNADTSKHGFLPKLDNDSTHFMNGQGSWASPDPGYTNGTDISPANVTASGYISAGGTGAGSIVFTGEDNNTATIQMVNQTTGNFTIYLPVLTADREMLTNQSIGASVQGYDVELNTIAALANGAGYLYNNGSGTFSYGTPGGGGNVTANSTSTDGNFVAYDGTSGELIKDSGYSASSFATPTDAKLNKDYKGFQLNNITANSTYVLWRAPYAITVTATHGVLTGGTYCNGYWAECDANGANCAGVDGSTAMNITTTNTNDDGTLSNPSIDSGDYIAFVTGVINGTCNITTGMDFTKN